MKNLSIFLFGLLVLAGCASSNVKQQAQLRPEATASTQTAVNNSSSAGSMTANGIPAKASLYFGFDQSTVSNADKPVLEANAKYLKEHSETKIVVQGNTDERGSSEYNLALGNRRAESAKKILTVLGVSNKKIEVVSFGKEKPKLLCHEESCWSENRRADIVYSLQASM